jgi:hypothetical protein
MSNRFLALGDYYGCKIVIKEVKPLDEIPVYYESDSTILKFGILADLDISPNNYNLTIKDIANEIKNDTIESKRRQVRNQKGEIIAIRADKDGTERHFFLLLLDTSLIGNPGNNRVFLKSVITDALLKAEQKKLVSVIVPNLCSNNRNISAKDLADSHFEAIEQFISDRQSTNVKVIYVCIATRNVAEDFLNSARIKFKKYNTQLFI